MDGMQDSRNINFEFNGKAGEYFKIWIVNIALTILTLGIYSAWAKVRTKRYFYGNTTLDGSSFEYLANPLAILKGRLIVFGFILMYAVRTQYMPMLEAAFFIIYMVALPWMVIKSMQFNTRNSAYRNIRFNFDGTVKESIFIFIALPIFSFVTLGFGLPYFIKRFKQFSIEHSYFGTSKFNFNATTGSFYKIYLKALFIPMLIVFIIGIIAAIAIPAYHGYITAQQTQTESMQIEEPVAQQNQIEQTDADETDTEQPLPDLQNQTATPPPPVDNITAIFPFLITMAFYLLIGVYIQTRTANLVLCSTTLEQHRLDSRLRVRNMFYIYLTNILAAILSLGMLIPWGKIRMTRYRLKNTSMIVHGDINNFIANEQEGVKATAGEFADAFDLDLSL